MALAVAALARLQGLQELRRHHARVVMAGEPGEGVLCAGCARSGRSSSAWMRTDGIGDIWVGFDGRTGVSQPLRASELSRSRFG